MLPNDNIYKVILTHRLPVSRGNLPVKAFLEQYFGEYVQSLRQALSTDEPRYLRKECYDLLEAKLPVIEHLCHDIIDTFNLYDSANMQELYSHFQAMMSAIEEYLFVENVSKTGHERFKRLFRIRAGNCTFERKDMFHIPFDKRQLINSYRYSIPGYPCLYLATGVELCWFECGMPKEFSYSAFAYNLTECETVKLLNFTGQPIDLISASVSWYAKNPQDADSSMIKYLVTHPLRAACSIQVKNKNSAFVEEYIFPQQLLLWIREHDAFDGIAYTTASSIEKAKEWNYFNIVFPAKKIVDGYCSDLVKLFPATEPVKVTIKGIFEKYADGIKKVQDFATKLESKYYNGYSLYPYREILSLCKTFLMACDALCAEDYVNGQLINQLMDSINLSTYLITENVEAIKTKAMQKAESLFYGIETAILSAEYDEVLKEFTETVKPVMFDLWDYAFKISCDTHVDYATLQSII